MQAISETLKAYEDDNDMLRNEIKEKDFEIMKLQNNPTSKGPT